MDDLISRQSAISTATTMCEWCDTGDIIDYRDMMVESLKVLPSAQQWIPVTERFPDLWDERYLVSLAWGGVGVMEYKSTGFHNYGSFSPVPIETVTAWMPLPEPYKMEVENDE